MKIKLTKASPEQLKTPPATLSGVVFGTLFSDHMFCMEWADGKGWHSAQKWFGEPRCNGGVRVPQARSTLMSGMTIIEKTLC